MNSGIKLSLTVALFSAPAWAQPVVEPSWLAQHIKDRDLVILHVGEEAGYLKAHIPGARRITVNDISKPNGGTVQELRTELPTVDILQSKFEALGVTDRSKVVIYGDSEQPLPNVTRVALVLRYLGLDTQTSVLNGGLAGWLKEGQSTTKDLPTVVSGKLTPKVNQSLFVDANFVTSLPQKPGYKLIDARAAANYKGISATFGKVGHIPGAVNIAFNEVNDDTQRFNLERIADVFKAAGVKTGDKLVVYCHIGLQGTEVILGARLLGIEASLYDGSFQDWAINDRGPVEK